VKPRDVAERRLLLLLAQGRIGVLVKTIARRPPVRRPLQGGDLSGRQRGDGRRLAAEIDISQTWLSSSFVRMKAIRRPSGTSAGPASITFPRVN
jgi:hypothetical protein